MRAPPPTPMPTTTGAAPGSVAPGQNGGHDTLPARDAGGGATGFPDALASRHTLSNELSPVTASR